MGGEKPGDYIIAADPEGSPPHGRGKVRVNHQGVRELGITPALAGKRRTGDPGQSGRWDHPRAGGEKTVSGAAFWLDLGSPPRRRGKVLQGLFQCFDKRITPA